MGDVRAVAAVGVGTLADQDGADAAQRILDLLDGEGADHVRADHTRAHALLAQAVGDVLRSLRGGVEEEHGDVGILHPVEVDDRVPAAAERLVLGEDLGDDPAGRVHRELELVLVVDQVRIVHVRPDRDRVPRVERRHALGHRPQELLHRRARPRRSGRAASGGS